MSVYAQKTSATTRRIKKVHKKARWVGFLYFLGTIAVTVLSLLGCLKIQFSNGDEFSIVNFFKPFLWIFKADFTGILTFLLFLIMLVIVLINFFRTFSTLRRVLKKNDKNINACNRNVSAMEDMAEIFSMNFSAVLILYALMYLVTPETGRLFIAREGMPLTLMGLILCAFALIIHFVAGSIGATCSLFIVGISVEERKREDGVFVFFIRSLIKILVLAAFLWLLLPACTIHTSLPLIFKFKFDELMPNGDFMPLLTLVLQIVAIVFVFLCVKKGTSSLEFNLIGMDAYGMRRFAAYALVAAIVSIAAFALNLGSLEEQPLVISYLIVGIVGIIAFVLDFIVKPHEKESKALKEMKAPQQEVREQPQPQAQPQARMGGFPTSIDLRLVLPQSSQQESTVGAAPRKWEVTCPTCGKMLAVKEAPYHRCPACGKVFRLNIGQIASGSAEGLEKQSEPVEEKTKKKRVKKERAPKKVNPKKLNKKAKKAEQEMVISNELAAQAE